MTLRSLAIGLQSIHMHPAGVDATGNERLRYYIQINDAYVVGCTLGRPYIRVRTHWARIYNLSLPLFPFVIGEVLPATSSPLHLIVFSILLSLLSSSSPAFLTSPPISTLASLVSSCLPHISTLASLVSSCLPPISTLASLVSSCLPPIST